VLLLSSLLLMLVLADVAGAAPAAGETTLEVPYLPQTEALCGGAAAAMLFRYWGDRHADVQQFEPLVDRRAGGIADVALVRAIEARSWVARRLDGSVAILRAHLAAGQPLMLLIEDRPQRYHYVVVVAGDEHAIYVHDPAWGPSRRLTLAQLERAWKPTNYWTLLVLPDRSRESPVPSPHSAAVGNQQPGVGAAASRETRSECDRLLDAALSDLARRGLDAADELIGPVVGRCPTSSAPLAELAGVRFAQRRLREASALAEQAVRLNPADAYAWDVLGSSRFLANDLHGALRAWNQIGKPQLDSVRIEGLAHTRYALIAEILKLTPNTLLSEPEFRFAERRLQQLPDRLTARIGYRPESDGFATVDVVVVERPTRPRGLVQWAAAGAETLIDREIVAAVPGRSGQGELWTASWRWWDDRPRVAFSLSAPRTGRVPGVWRLDGSWEAQTYAVDRERVRESRGHAGISVGDWLTTHLRYELTAGLDAWDESSRAVSVGGTIQHRSLDDRIALIAGASNWTPVAGGAAFRTGSLEAAFRTSTEPVGFVTLGRARVDAASEGAPLALWPGAGDGRARAGLLRAHPLLRDNVIAGPVFGRRVYSMNFEAQRWLTRPTLIRLGMAAFTDVAGASRRLASADGQSSHVDGGIGVRVRLPGRDGTLRIDYGRGFRDGADALTIGWQVP
jgi:hypothetical protein